MLQANVNIKAMRKCPEKYVMKFQADLLQRTTAVEDVLKQQYSHKLQHYYRKFHKMMVCGQNILDLYFFDG